jgi:hypothetical protein
MYANSAWVWHLMGAIISGAFTPIELQSTNYNVYTYIVTSTEEEQKVLGAFS